MDCAYVRLKTARTDGMRGSIIEVMNPQAKKSVVTAMNAARRSGFADGIECFTPWTPALCLRAGLCRPGQALIRRASGIGKRLATELALDPPDRRRGGHLRDIPASAEPPPVSPKLRLRSRKSYLVGIFVNFL